MSKSRLSEIERGEFALDSILEIVALALPEALHQAGAVRIGVRQVQTTITYRDRIQPGEVVTATQRTHVARSDQALTCVY